MLDYWWVLNLCWLFHCHVNNWLTNHKVLFNGSQYCLFRIIIEKHLQSYLNAWLCKGGSTHCTVFWYLLRPLTQGCCARDPVEQTLESWWRLICGLCSARYLLRSGSRVISLPLSSLGWCTSVAFCSLASKRLTLFFITFFPFNDIFWRSVTGASYISSITVTDWIWVDCHNNLENTSTEN